MWPPANICAISRNDPLFFIEEAKLSYQPEANEICADNLVFEVEFVGKILFLWNKYLS